MKVEAYYDKFVKICWVIPTTQEHQSEEQRQGKKIQTLERFVEIGCDTNLAIGNG